MEGKIYEKNGSAFFRLFIFKHLFLGPWELRDRKEKGAELKAMIRNNISHTQVKQLLSGLKEIKAECKVY